VIGMEILGERPLWSMSDSEKLSSLDAAYAEIARLETLSLHLIAGLDTTGYAKELGAGTTARLLTFRYRIDAAKARRDVHLANALPKYPAVAAALPDPNPHHTPDTADENSTDECSAGEEVTRVGVLLHPAQAEAIVSSLDKVPTTVPADDFRVAEEELVELARTHGPLQLRDAGKQFRHRLDTDGPEPEEQKAYNRESLAFKKTDNGIDFRGYLANENAELFRTLIHVYAKAHKTIDGALDPRPSTKRQADALTTLLTIANNPTTITPASPAPATTNRVDESADTLPGMPADTASAAIGITTAATHGAADCPAPVPPPGPAEKATDAGHRRGGGFIPGHGPKAHITVTIDFNDLKAATADKIGHLIYGDGLSAATIRRLACDAQILPMVLGSDSQPLDVGTTVRLATGPMRKGLIARDKGCVCCGAPPIYCDAHHVISWIDGGATKLTNLVLLCKRCHRDLHDGHWDVQITNGVVHVSRPTWATPGPVPRGRYRPPAATATTSGSTTVGGSARAWPRDTDPPWITSDDAARLNPWGDSLEGVPSRGEPAEGELAQGAPREGGPGGYVAFEERPTPAPAGTGPSDFDPWGDGSTVNIRSGSNPAKIASAAFAPWGHNPARC
jgi:hypothetical protein